MSDPVTNVEIEDVLSSIRRLVSVDSARTRRAPPPEASQKLVLTEDYRIPPEPDVAEQPSTTEMASDYTRTLERRIAELEAAVTEQAAEFEPDGSEDTSQHRPTSMLFTAPEAPTPKPEQDGAVALEALVADDHDDEPNDAVLADTERASDVTEVSAEPDVEEPATQDDEAHVEHAEMWSEDENPVLFHPAPDDDRIEVLDAESRRTADRRADPEEFTFSTDDTVIDEETLRDMVAEIVRDELQGALGERITRNVRKLVRREIMRAISIRDFD